MICVGSAGTMQKVKNWRQLSGLSASNVYPDGYTRHVRHPACADPDLLEAGASRPAAALSACQPEEPRSVNRLHVARQAIAGHEGLNALIQFVRIASCACFLEGD